MLYDSLIVVGMLLLAGAIALPVTGGEQQAFRDLFFTLYLLGVWFLYLGACWTLAGQTLGMRAWKVRLSGIDGSGLSWRTSLVRFLVSLVSGLALGAGFWTSLLHCERACWHDRASHTRLLRLQD